MSSISYKNYTSGEPQRPGESTWKYNIRKLFTVKSLDDIEDESKSSGLKKALNAFDLTMLGVGGIIGAGIFVLTGHAAADNSGPAIVLSYIISGIAASFAALSYSELASMIPVSGSAYTYSYATLGELVAWIIGWDLLLEYLVGTAAVSVSWSGYFVYFCSTFNVQLSSSWTSSPLSYNSTTQSFELIPGSYFNVPAFTLVVILTILLFVGIKESASVNAVMVGVKVFVIVLFIIAGATKINRENYKPFVPPNDGKFGEYGVSGIFAAASVVFFAYIGFDSVSTIAQESKNPKRDLPIGIIGSLAICTILYIAVSLVATGVVPYKTLDGPAPIAVAATAVNMRWLGIIVDIGALLGLTTTCLVTFLGQTRIFYSMSKDGLLPNYFSKIHPRFQTPYISVLIIGFICAIAAALLPIDILADLTSVGTLFAFLLVNVGVIVLRKHAPDAPRNFKVPGGPYLVPIVGSLFDIALLATSTKESIERLFIWMAIGLVIYSFYGRRNSVANNSSHVAHGERKIDTTTTTTTTTITTTEL